MNNSSLDRRTLYFIGIFLGIYLLWVILYYSLIQPWGKLDTLVINDSSLWSLFFLQHLGYPTFIGPNPTMRTIGIDGSSGIWIGDPCNGLTLFALFIAFIIAYPGSWKHKIWFIPMGVTVIHFFNIIRITLLCIMVVKSPEWLEFNHTYLFQIIIYGIIFLLWYIWIKKFGKIKKISTEK